MSLTVHARSAAVLALSTFILSACGSEGGGVAPFNETITAEGLRTDLTALSADSMRGRLVGTPELERAADWIASRFQALGLAPAGTDGFNEGFDLIWPSLGVGNFLTVEDASPRRVGDGWYPVTVSGSAASEGALVFAGFGIVEPRIGYDSYGGASVAGKIVLILDREPGVSDPASPFDGVVTTEGAAAWRKVVAAQEHGAVGVLFVRDVHNRPEVDDFAATAAAYWTPAPRRIERFTLGVWMDRITIPVAQISADAAAELLTGLGRTLEDLAASAETSTGVVEIPGVRLSLTTNVVRHVTPGRNVLAMIEGSDPTLRNEVVIIAAHHDHNGADGDQIFNGADDDGSGIVGMLAAAAAYSEAARAGRLPLRTVLFAAWDAEERGLLGAWYHTERPRFPLERTVAVLNLDMIGRNEEVPVDGGGRFNGLEVQTAESNANAINILGYSRTPELSAVVEAANAAYGLELKLRYDNNTSNLLRRSDHWPFLQSGVPAVWFHNGLHPDYHTVDDDADRIEYAKMERIVRLVHQTSWNLANALTRPTIASAMGPGGVAEPQP